MTQAAEPTGCVPQGGVQQQADGPWNVEKTTTNATFSESEIVNIKQQFNAMDKDGDGLVTESEFAESIKNSNRNPEDYNIQQFFSGTDNNKDGKITFSKFLEVYKSLGLDNSGSGSGKEKSTKEVDAIFKSFDRDGDGSISAKELTEVLANQGDKPSQAEVQEMIKAADKNNDNKVDREEFAKMV
ncbi:hypothetical protein EDD11_005035 [Mortierella claussenii]|nr:hypothetical protein EDD11_005035 [Mortierella claussenii]